MDIKIFSGSSNPSLVSGICNALSIKQGLINLHSFPSGEKSVQIQENIRGQDIFLVQSFASPVNDNLMELIVMADAARRASAGAITAVCTYLGYMRSDRKVKSRTPIAGKVVINLLEAAGITRFVTMDLHSGQAQGFTDLPFDHLYAMPLFFNVLGEILQNPKDIVFVSPDIGAIKRTEAYQKCVEGAGFAVCPKTRVSETEVKTHPIIGDVKNKIAILPDDLTESCGTILGAAKLCKEAGAKKVFGCVTHGLFTQTGYERLVGDKYLDALLVTDTVHIPKTFQTTNMQIISSAPLFAKAINCIHNNESVSGLFKIEGF